jgi:hypothetical protein
MADKSLEVKISADVTSLQAQIAVGKVELSGLNATVKSLATQFVAASDEMKASLAPQLEDAAKKAGLMKAEVADLNAQLKVVPHEEVVGFFGQFTAAMDETTEKIEGLTDKLGGFSKLTAAVTEFVAAGLAVEQVADAIKETAETGEQLGQLSEKTGISTVALSGLRVAAVETNTDMDTLSTGLRNLARNVQTAIVTPTSNAAQSFRAMGVSVTDASGAMLPLDDILGQLAAKYSTYSDGAAKADLASDQFGVKVGSSLIPVLDKIGQETIPGLTQKAAELGVSFNQAAVDADTEFSESMKNAGLEVEGFRDTIANGLIPALGILGGSFTTADGGMSALQATAVVLEDGLKVLVEAFELVASSAEIVFDQALLVGQEFGSLINMSRALSLAMVGDFRQAAEVVESSGAQMAQSYNDDIAKMEDHEKTFLATHNALWGNLQVQPAPPPATPQQAPELQAKSSGGDFMAEQNAALDQQNEKIEQSADSTKEANSEKLQNTVQFWQGVLSAGNLSAAQELQAQNALTKAETALRANQLSTESGDYKSAETTKTQIAADAAAARKAIATSEYDAQVSQWGAEVDEKKITKSQEVQDEIAAQNQMYEAALAEAQQEAALLQAGTAAKAKALDDIEVMQAAHVATMAQLNEELVSANVDAANTLAQKQKEAADATSAAWQKAFAPITQAFDSSLNGVIQGTQTLQQAEMKAAQSITLAFIDAEAKKVEAFAVGELEILAGVVRSELGMTAAAAAGNATRVSLKASADATGSAVDAASNSASIANSAHTAFAGAYAAVAGVPFVGPVLAPAAGAAAYAAVMAMDVLSASGGLAIGAGENPLVQLHENETVLPAYIAQPLTAMLAGGGNMATDNSVGDTTVNNHFNMTANGGSNGLQPSDLLSMLNTAVRSGSLQGYPALARAMRRGN